VTHEPELEPFGAGEEDRARRPAPEAGPTPA
jgi:hypothetical protein